jgi:hypothetical protein
MDGEMYEKRSWVYKSKVKGIYKDISKDCKVNYKKLDIWYFTINRN